MGDTDRCCRECASSFKGICHRRRDCWCHLEARAEENWSGPLPYADPTANRAIGNITRARRRQKRKER
jgi:hypothetical protein